jgi:F-type H+-transporting ATPase subunit delta
MAGSKVANRYALSLLDVALEKKKLTEIYNDSKLLVDTLSMSDELMRAIQNPIIKPEVKISILDKIFSKRIDKETINFIHFLVEKRREEILYLVMKRFMELRNDHLGIVELGVSTSFELSKDQKSILKEKFEKILKKKVNPIFSIDKNLIGGFMAKVGDTVYDASMKHQLELLKKEFIQGSLFLN